MTMLSPHFSAQELLHSDEAVRRGISNIPLPDHMAHLLFLCDGLEKVRSLIGDVPMTITSGYRCPELNEAVGGVPDSDHALGYAADFMVPGHGLVDIAQTIIRSGIAYDQLIHETSRHILHISFNPRMRRQVLTQDAGPGSPFKTGIS